MGRFAIDRKTVAYNDDGDQIEEVFDDEERDYAIDDEGRLSDAPTRRA